MGSQVVCRARVMGMDTTIASLESEASQLRPSSTMRSSSERCLAEERGDRSLRHKEAMALAQCR